MELISSFKHEFIGFGIHPSACKVHIFKDELNIKYIIFEDIAEGTSVTNATEQLAGEIVNKFNYDPHDCKFYETYSQHCYDTFDQIIYTWIERNSKYEAHHAQWKSAPTTKNQFVHLLDI